MLFGFIHFIFIILLKFCYKSNNLVLKIKFKLVFTFIYIYFFFKTILLMLYENEEPKDHSKSVGH